MEVLIIIMIGVALYAAIAAPIKRSKHTAKCPKCGTTCQASPWSPGLNHYANYKCPCCGNTFMEHYSHL